MRTLGEHERAVLLDHLGPAFVSFSDAMSVADARVLASIRGDLDLMVSRLEEGAAQALGAHVGHLVVLRLPALTNEEAAGLGKKRGGISLPACRHLSDRSISALCQHKRQHLDIGISEISEAAAADLVASADIIVLDHLRGLTADAAKALAAHDGTLYITVSELSPLAAQSLSSCMGALHLSLGRDDLPFRLTPDVARELSRSRGRLMLDSVEFQPHAAAVLDALAPYAGTLRIGSDVATTKEVASSLAKHRGELIVSFGSELRTDVACELAKHRGDLTILAPRELSQSSAAQLATHACGKLTITRLEALSESVAHELSKHCGPLDITVDNAPSDEAVAALFAHNGTLGVPLSFVRPGTIASLVAHGGGLRITGHESDVSDTWSTLSDELFDRLLLFKGPLYLEGEIPRHRLVLLSSRRGPLALSSVPQDEQVATTLLNREGNLYFPDRSSIESVSAARLFTSSVRCGVLSTTTTQLIGPEAHEAAEVLISREGPLAMPYLRYVSAAALRVLCTKSDLSLPRLEELHILSELGEGVIASDVVPKDCMRTNAASPAKPPPREPSWHSWERLLRSD